METRANFVVIGICTLLAIAGALGFFVWLAQFEVNRQFNYYDIVFDNVSGLSRASDVRFNGLSVGQVVTIGLSDTHIGKVSAKIEVAAGTPINEDTTAQLASQGVTGVSYVALTSGRDDAAPLVGKDGHLPEIIAKRSVIEALSHDAPDLVAQAKGLVEDVRKVFTPELAGQVSQIVGNLDKATQDLSGAFDNFAKIADSFQQASGEVGAFTKRLDPIGDALQTSLGNLDGTLTAAKGAFAAAETTLGGADGTLDSARKAIDNADATLRAKLPGIMDDLSETTATLRTAVAEVSSGTNRVVSQAGDATDAATARLNELKGTIETLDKTLSTAQTTLASVSETSDSVNALVSGEGTGLVTDARATLAEVKPSIEALNRMMAEDVPGIVSGVKGAVASANRVIEDTGQHVDALADGLQPLTAQAGTTLAAATKTLQDAGATLDRIDGALGTAEGALTAAQGTFVSAQRVMDQDVSPAAADIREAASGINASVGKVADDLPAITSQLRDAIAKADTVIGRVDTMVATSAAPINDFTRNGLPQFVRFTAEARALVARLDALTARLERDPAGALLGNRVPDYRR
jgi:phospholipid/cholesterol/gamma-HCH transport system substrate-binding protein